MSEVAETKHCPYCDEKIMAKAIKCKHCGSTLQNATTPSELENSSAVPPATPVAPKEDSVANAGCLLVSILVLLPALSSIIWFAFARLDVSIVNRVLISVAIFIFVWIVLVLYFLPFNIAVRKNSPYKWVIFWINLFFGLTGIGWVGALIFAIWPVKDVKSS
jgi:hypothetical protein